LNRIGNIQLFAEIKRGEHGSTFRGLDVTKQEFVLVKTIHAAAGSVQDTGAQSRFEQEAAIYASIQHANVVKLLHYGTIEAQRYIALEFVDGLTLRALLDRASASGSLPWQIAVALFCDVLQGVQEIHKRGIIHRDLKPENVLIGNNGEVKICDFDLALSEQTERSSGLTGSPGYMAPETVLGEKPALASDIFSLGIIFYESLTTARPFQAPSATGEMNAIVKLPHVSLLALNPALPECLDELIDRLLAKKTGARASSTSEVLSWLQDHFDIGAKEARREMIHRHLSDAQTVLPVIAVKQPEVEDAKPEKNKAWSPTRRIAIGIGGIGLLVAWLLAWNNYQTSDARQTSDTPVNTIQPESTTANTSVPLKDVSKISDITFPLTKKSSTGSEAAGEKSVDPPASAEPKSFLVSIVSNPWAFVFVDGDSIGQTPLSSPIALREGRHELHFRNPKLPLIRAAVMVDTTVSDTLSFSLWDHLAQLEIQIRPWAEMFIDGRRRELPPGENTMILLPGTHALRFVHPQLGEKSETVFLRAGETRKLTMIMF
jgi:serine/threonine-protein kinase